MKINSNCIPNHILKLMPKEDRPKGVEGFTKEECSEIACKKLEKDHHNVFSQWLNLNNIPFVHSRTDRKTTNEPGVPDYIVILKGKAICIEFKVNGNKLSEGQEKFIAKLKENGTETHVVSMAADAIEIVKKIKI